MLVSYTNAFPNGYFFFPPGLVFLRFELLTALVFLCLYLGDRDEEGFYYGLNLRGTNFLILCARLGGKNAPISDIHREEIPIPPNVMNGNTEVCFLYFELWNSFMI